VSVVKRLAWAALLLIAAHDNSHIFTQRAGKLFRLAPNWTLSTRLDLPFLLTDALAGTYTFGLGDFLHDWPRSAGTGGTRVREDYRDVDADEMIGARGVIDPRAAAAFG
jgi:hypothetical protein